MPVANPVACQTTGNWVGERASGAGILITRRSAVSRFDHGGGLVPFVLPQKLDLERLSALHLFEYREQRRFIHPLSIDRENPRAALKSMRAASAQVEKGTSVVIFPEGGTSVDGVMHPFKGGGFVLATHSMIDVVPVTIRGSRQVLVPKTYQIRSGNVEVIIDPPISSYDLSANDLAARTYETMLQRFSALPDSSA